MARAPLKTQGKSKIRFIMLEAELSEGDLSEVTSAIQNALRPKQPQLIVQRLETDNGSSALDLETDDLTDLASDLVDDAGDNDGRPQARRRKPTYRTPKVVDLECDASPSLKDYVTKHSPSTLNDKHLAVLAWANAVDGLGSLNIDQVYTAFRHLGWPSGQKDFSQPLRDLKKQQLITGGRKTDLLSIISALPE